MQISCPQCRAEYLLEGFEVPAAGMQARCSGCQAMVPLAAGGSADAPVVDDSVLEVLGPADALQAPPAQITIACPSCHGLYQFAASEIPAEGYDAQCTQCGAVFFMAGTGEVRPADGVAPPPPPAAPEPRAQAAVRAASAASSSARAAPALEPSAARRATAPQVPDFLPDEETDAAFESAVGRRSTFWPALLIVLTLAAMAIGASYVYAPRLFDRYVGRFVGLRAPSEPAPRATPAMPTSTPPGRRN